ncbi:J domain-containing protein [Aurantibacillus circumpalustris]|uniref:J domain-containing protein n=1 Tax=Aurantibacillus circumpalustris TaxID=3036359 RepID=UPI00295C2E39|nr:J domain-containing protein [Aurantibacillus circumpalustris]
MEFIDYYKTLEIDKTASDAEIKKAYRKLARKYHPDLNPNDANAKQKFQRINEANEVLSDPEKRKKYDQYGKDWEHSEAYEQARQQQGQRTSGSGQRGYQSTSDFGGEDFSDFFSSMFGGNGGGRNVKYKGQDLSAQLSLDITDVYKSHQQTLTVNGKNIRLTIPAGVENGQTIRIKGHGGAGANGGPSGDLLITFSIKNDTAFKRGGSDLFSVYDLDLYTAVLGGETTVNTFDGKVKLKVAAGTQSGTKVKLKGKGFPVYKNDGNFGDLFITYQIQVPTNLSDKEKELFQELLKIKQNGK